MDVELARGVEEDHVVVRCDDAALGQALVDLYFSRDGDRYVKRFPAGSFTDGMLDRFREALVPLLRQTARLDPVPWREALRDAIRRLDGAGIDWWLAGSAALGARGLQVEPRDIDLVISEADVSRAADAFEDVLIEPAVETDGWIARWFGRAWLVGLCYSRRWKSGSCSRLTGWWQVRQRPVQQRRTGWRSSTACGSVRPAAGDSGAGVPRSGRRVRK
jgi:hypothetical protein